MKRLARSLITGGIIGAAVGVSLLMMKKGRARESSQPSVGRALWSADRSRQQTQNGMRGAAKMVRDNTMRWTSAMKNSTDALSKRLTRRLT